MNNLYKNIITTGLPILLWASANAQTPTRNFVQTRVPRKEIGTTAKLEALTANKDSVERTIGYLDGLGRPIQTIQVKGSMNGRDVVQSTAYDEFGREAKKYLAYGVNNATNTGAFIPDALTPGAGVFNYYNPTAGNTNPQQTNGAVRTAYPYAVTGFEPSPLNRVVEQGAPGLAWQLPGAGNAESTGHTQRIVYSTNDLTAFNATPSASNLGSHTVALYTAGILNNNSRSLGRKNNNATYNPGELYLTIKRDENWQPTDGCVGTTEEYKDKEGHTILVRTYNKISATQLEMLSTYYIYDDLGYLSYVLPPGASPDANAAISQATRDNFCYQYRYDVRGRAIEKKIPGKGWELTVYNGLDQVVGTQDSVQRMKAPQEWTIIKYDGIGRLVKNGVWQHTGTTEGVNNRATVQSLVTDVTTLWESRTAGTDYTNAAWPLTNISVTLQQNYYDDYSFPGVVYTSSAYSSRTKGLMTASKTNILGTSDMLWTDYRYDEDGRLARKISQHYLGGATQLNKYNYDQIIYTYNFNNQVIRAIRTHLVRNTAGGAGVIALTLTENYTYDHKGRKRFTKHQIKNASDVAQTAIYLHAITYNETGQLIKKALHGLSTTGNYLQTIDYRYNERGWLSSINNSGLNNDLGYTNGDLSDQFGMNLQYNETTTSRPQYNGNISTISWRQGVINSITPSAQLYNYGYDRVNRLTDAVSTTVTSKDGFYDEHLKYDQMGNVKTLGRYEKGASSRLQIDTLTYTYTGNKLTRVDDASPVYLSSGFQDAVKVANEYTYDGNGNTLTDQNKGITSIGYNMLNVTQSVVLPAGTITYIYDASGRKLKKVFGTTITEYIDGIQYTNGVIDFVQTEEGRARKSGTLYVYEYDLKDHLGNIRNTLTWNSSDATQMTPKVLQQNDYYAFGLSIKSLEPVVPSPKNQYLYNGKELQEETGVYDYGARFYDPVIIKWTAVDRYAQKYPAMSPYSYAGNNPIRNIDINGDSIRTTGSASATATFRQTAEASTGNIATMTQANNGNWTLSTLTDEQSLNMTDQQAEAYNGLSNMISNANTASFSLIDGNDAMSQNVVVGDNGTAGTQSATPGVHTIDMGDVKAMGSTGILTAAGALGHELKEGFNIQTKNLTTPAQIMGAHRDGIRFENAINGSGRYEDGQFPARGTARVPVVTTVNGVTTPRVITINLTNNNFGYFDINNNNRP